MNGHGPVASGNVQRVPKPRSQARFLPGPPLKLLNDQAENFSILTVSGLQLGEEKRLHKLFRTNAQG